MSGIGTVTAGLAGQPVVSVPSLDSAVGEQSDALNDSLDRLLDGFDTLNIAVSAAGDTLTCDLRAVNDRLGRVISAVCALTASPDAGGSDTIFADVSRDQAEQWLQEQGDGCLVNAANTGEVKGDSRAGGIVGSLANELDTDPAAHWQQQGDGSTLSAEVQLCLIVLDCRNSGTVTARKAEAGGIAGRMDFGYTADCENTGDVTGASQVGGVAGRSAGVLESCWVRCALTGGEEVGGVAGYGGEINNCRTMVELLPGEDTQAIRYAGTIAGRAASNAALADNQYVHESLGAVDGVTRAAQALPANFESLAAGPDAPDGFARLELTFTADGKTVATVTFRYGEGVTSLPAVPQKDGYVGSGRTWITPILRTVRQWKPNTFLMHLPWLMTAARHHKFWWMEASAHRPKSRSPPPKPAFPTPTGGPTAASPIRSPSPIRYSARRTALYTSASPTPPPDTPSGYSRTIPGSNKGLRWTAAIF